MQPLQLKAQQTKASRRSDGSVAITYVTADEVGSTEFTKIDEYWKQHGWLLFKPNAFSNVDIPTEEAEIKGQVSDSQYLRRCLFKKHMAKGGTKESFPNYYHKAMAGFAQAVTDSMEE